MFNPGTSTNHSNRHDHGLAASFDNLGDVSWAIKSRLVAAAAWSDGRFIFGKGSAAGFQFTTATARGMFRARTHTGSASASAESTIAISDDQTYSIVGRHKSATDTNFISIQGVQELESTAGGNRDPGDGTAVAICSHSGLGGAAVIVGQCMIWPNYFLTNAEQEDYHAGLVVPAAAKLGFWDKCIVEPGVDLVGGGSSSENGTITLLGDDVDGMFSGQGLLLPHRQLAGHGIRVLSCSPELYKLTVPPEYAALLLGSDVSIHDGELPAASSILAQLDEHFMLDDYRGIDGVILEANIEPNMELSILILNRLPSMCFFYQTLALDKGQLVNNEEEGTASLVPWAVQTNSRNSQHFLEDATEETSRTRLGSIGRFAAKTNHRGTLYEVGVENLVQNSAFLDDGAGPPTFLDTTEDLGTAGTVTVGDITDVPMLFIEKTIQGKTVRVAKLTKGSAGNISLQWTLAIDTSGDDGRVTFWHRGKAGNYAIQRSSDSKYWSAGSTWGAITWHALGASTDEWLREITNVIGGIPTSGDLKLIVGQESGTGAENDVIYFAQMFCYQHWAIFSDIVTQGGATSTSEDDDEVWDLDNEGNHDAQTFNPNRGTVRVLIRFETDTDDIPNDYFAIIAEFGVDSSNYDQCFIGRNSGGVLRVWIQRYIASGLDGNAFKTISDYSRGDELELAFRWTDTRGVELGLAARTLSTFEAGVKGTDDQSAGIHSTSDQTTFLRWGNTGTVRAPATFFYLKNVELVQWVISDEAILGRRVFA